MIWLCEGCNNFCEGADDVELAVARQTHLDTDHGRTVVPEPPEPTEDTVLNLKYAAWGTSALVALLSMRWPDLGYVLPFTTLIAFVLTYHESAS